MKIYTGKRLRPYNNECRENTLVKVDEKPLLPYFGNSRRFDCVFDWGEYAKGFGGMHLAVSILADFYNIKNDPDFPSNMREIVLAFFEQFICPLDHNEWELDSDEISDWLEQQLPITYDETDEQDTREINFYISSVVEPNGE